MRFLSLSFIAALLTSPAAVAQIPQTSGSNVLISRCDPLPYSNAVESGFLVTPYRSSLYAILAVDYRNEAASPITAIVFGLVSGGKLIGIGEDEGRFAQDAAIDHQLMVHEPIFPLHGPAQCVVLRVLYANGTAWFNPASPRF